MTAAFSKLKSHLAGWRNWELNPIVIKELRQAVRSWAVTGMLLLFLTVLFLASLGFLVTQSFSVDANMRLGGTMFSVFTVILAVASIFFIPLYLGIRVAAERQENNPDLLYVSTLSPGRIIRGKFFCGAYMALLFFSACMPFMAFTNLLRGVDLPTVFLILFYLFLVVCAANMVAIFFACLPISRPFKILITLFGFIFLTSGIFPVLSLSFFVMRSGVGTIMMGGHASSGHNFWANSATTIGIGAAFTGLFYVLSVGLVSPPSMNRAFAPRIYITVVWLLGGLLSIGWASQIGGATPIFAWATYTFILMFLSLIVVISNSDEISLRVRRSIPKSGLKRLFAFLFFNGAAGGLVWAAIIVALTFFITKWILAVGNGWFPKGAVSFVDVSGSGQFLLASISMLFYAFAYALTALLIHRKFFFKRTTKLVGLLAVLLIAAWAILPGTILFFMNKLSWNSVEGLQLGNVFNVFSLRDDDRRIYHLYFAGGWLALMLVLNARWFVRQAKNFKPLATDSTENAPPVLN